MNGLGRPAKEGESPVIEIVKTQLNEEYGETREILSEYARTIS